MMLIWFWTDDEVQMLLKTTRDFKVGKAHTDVLTRKVWKKNTRKYEQNLRQIYFQEKIKCFHIQ